MCVPQEATSSTTRLQGEVQSARQQIQKLQAAAEASKLINDQQTADIQVSTALASATLASIIPILHATVAGTPTHSHKPANTVRKSLGDKWLESITCSKPYPIPGSQAQLSCIGQVLTSVATSSAACFVSDLQFRVCAGAGGSLHAAL